MYIYTCTFICIYAYMLSYGSPSDFGQFWKPHFRVWIPSSACVCMCPFSHPGACVCITICAFTCGYSQVRLVGSSALSGSLVAFICDTWGSGCMSNEITWCWGPGKVRIRLIEERPLEIARRRRNRYMPILHCKLGPWPCPPCLCVHGYQSSPNRWSRTRSLGTPCHI